MQIDKYHISSVMVSVVDRGNAPRSGQAKDYIQLVYANSPITTQLNGVRSNTVWFGIKILCPSDTFTSKLLFR